MCLAILVMGFTQFNRLASLQPILEILDDISGLSRYSRLIENPEIPATNGVQ